MAWLQLRVHSRHPEFADEILHAHDAKAVSFVYAVDDPVLEPAPGETRLWANTVTLGLFVDGADLAPVQASLRELLPDGDEARFETELIEDQDWRSEEHTSELQSLMRISYAVFCLKKKKNYT